MHCVRDAAPHQHADAAADIGDHGEPADLHVGEIAERLDDLRNEIEHAEARRDDAEIVHGQQQHLGIDHRLPEIVIGDPTPHQQADGAEDVGKEHDHNRRHATEVRVEPRSDLRRVVQEPEARHGDDEVHQGQDKHLPRTELRGFLRRRAL